MTYQEQKPNRSFIETLDNASLWGIWFAIVASLMTILCYIGWATGSEHIIFLSTIGAIWTTVYAGLKLDLEMP